MRYALFYVTMGEHFEQIGEDVILYSFLIILGCSAEKDTSISVSQLDKAFKSKCKSYCDDDDSRCMSSCLERFYVKEDDSNSALRSLLGGNKKLTPEEAAKKITADSSGKDDAAAVCSCFEGILEEADFEVAKNIAGECMSKVQGNPEVMTKVQKDKKYGSEFEKAFRDCMEPLEKKLEEKFKKQ